jgi:hypothetical protein
MKTNLSMHPPPLIAQSNVLQNLAAESSTARPWLAAGYRVSSTLWQGLGLLCVSRFGRQAPLSFWANLILSVLIMGGAVALNRQALRPHDQAIWYDQHAMISLEMAVNRCLCGAPSHVSWPIPKKRSVDPSAAPSTVRQLVANSVDVLARPVLRLREDLDVSPADYSEHLFPFRNNENFLMLVDAFILRLSPRVTVRGMILAHTMLKIGCLFVFGYFLLRTGASLLLGLGILYFACLITCRLNESMPISLYPYLLPVTLLLIGCLGLAVSYQVYRRLWLSALVALGLGVLSACLSNLRSSYMPVAVALQVLYCVTLAWESMHEPALLFKRRLIMALLPPIGLIGGAVLFGSSFIAPIERATMGSVNCTHHVIAHPIVLCLAVPPCEFSNKENIKFDDCQGLELARRIDPDVKYLGQLYDRTLFVYYVKLWTLQPAAMLATYSNKFRLAGMGAVKYIDALFPSKEPHSALMHWLSVPIGLLPSGFAYAGLFLASMALAACGSRFLNTGAWFACFALAGTALLLWFECALLYTVFAPQYHAILLFSFIAVGLLTYQFALDMVVTLVGCVVVELSTLR